MRLQSLKFLKNYKIQKDKKTCNVLKSLIPIIIELNQDGSLEVR